MAWLLVVLWTLSLSSASALAEPSVRPGVNDHYEDARYEDWVGVFESPRREVYARRDAIVDALGLQAGMAVADIGAGTGLFTRLFAREVGPRGRVYAVDIAPDFVASIMETARARGLTNVEGVVNDPRDVHLPEASVDLAFLCDTYHHLEYPRSMLESIRRALKPGAQLVVVDFRRVPGRSSPWVMGHVRAGRAQVIREIEAAGFEPVEDRELLRTNYFLRFRRL
jgi:ubiquinone/menaquinone biosynthesis C-methylase UbiE